MKAKAKKSRTQRTPSPSVAPPKRAKSDALLDELARAATEARERAYAPYSRYRVGAAIATKSGRVFTGCNVENATFGATICAERGAVMQMIAAGERDPIACAVVTVDGGSPCGICRQVLAEFARDMPIALIAAKDDDEQTGLVVRLAELLPLAFALRTKA
jgi:cytidine deaminase